MKYCADCKYRTLAYYTTETGPWWWYWFKYNFGRSPNCKCPAVLLPETINDVTGEPTRREYPCCGNARTKYSNEEELKQSTCEEGAYHVPVDTGDGGRQGVPRWVLLANVAVTGGTCIMLPWYLGIPWLVADLFVITKIYKEA